MCRKALKNLVISELLISFVCNEEREMKFDIIDIEEFSGPKARIYSIMYACDDRTLVDHFFDENTEEHRGELEEIALKLRVMGSDYGCRAHYFKENEGVPADGVAALRCRQMRLYCLRYDNTCVFIGSGGYKPPGIKAYQEDPFLASKAEEMKKIAACINKAIKEKDLRVRDDGTLDMSEFIELEI